MTTDSTAETLEQEYTRLLSHRYQLGKELQEAAGDVPAVRAALRDATARLREIAAIPPAGYALPKAAAGLMAVAHEHGWTAIAQWTPPGYDGAPFVTVHVGRGLRPGEQPDARGNGWHYQLTWHSRDCAPGRLRLFGRCLAETPEQPCTHDGPSVTRVRAVIQQHPAPDLHDAEGATAA